MAPVGLQYHLVGSDRGRRIHAQERLERILHHGHHHILSSLGASPCALI